MVKSAAAQTVSTDAFALLTVIATTEDARRYAGPVSFYNEQLMMLLGFGSKKRLVAARLKAINSGWLEYRPGGKGVAGSYFVRIPTNLDQIPDGPSDESGGFCRSDTELQTELQTDREHRFRSDTEPKADPMRNRKGTSYIPSPNPSPNTIVSWFDSWYAKYPRKAGRGRAAKAFRKAIEEIVRADGVDADSANRLLSQWTAERLPGLIATEPKFRPHPATWLNDERYRDDIGGAMPTSTAAIPKSFTPAKPRDRVS